MPYISMMVHILILSTSNTESCRNQLHLIARSAACGKKLCIHRSYCLELNVNKNCYINHILVKSYRVLGITTLKYSARLHIMKHANVKRKDQNLRYTYIFTK